MHALPSRPRLTALTAAASAVVPCTTLGFARLDRGDRATVLYWHSNGIGRYEVALGEVPSVFAPAGDEVRECAAAALGAPSEGPFAFLMAIGTARRVASFPVRGCDPPTRFWVGLAGDEPLGESARAALDALAEQRADAWDPSPPEDLAEWHDRLELAADLLPSLLHVLDPRDVFERLSIAARRALPHDLLLLRLFNDDLTRITVFARSDRGTSVLPEVPNPYPAAATRAWDFDITDDLRLHPLEGSQPPVRLGARSALRLPIRFDERVIGGIGFLSFATARYTTADVAIARRLADHVAVGLSHYQQAARLAEQARRTEELRARAASLDLLDAVLANLADAGDLSQTFERVADAAAKVLPHDGAALAVWSGSRRAPRLHTIGAVRDAQALAAEAARLAREEAWEPLVTGAGTSDAQAPLLAAGLPSVICAPILVERRPTAALWFASAQAGAFSAADLPVVHRVADRIALTIARDRETAAERRADEASARAAALEARVRSLTEELDARTGFRRVVGESPPWRRVLTQATQVAATDTTVLLLGESGTGKEVIARFIHRASARARAPFVALNCAALPEQLLEAELFGYERGAYTGATQSKPGQLEQASGGTLFLDEVGEMSLAAQAKFLRVLQEREFQRLGGTRVLRTDARIVAATNRDLQMAIGRSQFREDLYYRLHVFAIRLPALRERRDDILPLSEAFLSELSRGLGCPPGGISREARRVLVDYHWPGNVRELRNSLERAAILCDGGLITPEHLALGVGAPPPQPSAAPLAAGPGPLPVPVEDPAATASLPEMERAMIAQALQQARFNKSRAAQALGLTRHQLYVRLRKHGLE